MTAEAPFVIVATGLAFESRIARGGGVHVCCGQGEHLAAALQEAKAECCRGVLSFGIAAGLDPALAPGTAVIVSDVVQATGEAIAADQAWQTSLLDRCKPAVRGRLLGIDRPVADVETKHGLHRDTGAVALDMESHVAAAFAAEHALPFAALRVVADPAGGAVPELAVKAMRPDGTADIAAILRALAHRPAGFLPLIRVAGETGRARRTLVRARRRLGFGFGLLDIG